MQRFLILLLVFVAFSVTACGGNQTLKDAWKFTKRQHTTYLNKPATLNKSDPGRWQAHELALGEAVFIIDNELQRLIRAMENSDHRPDQDWVLNMVGGFPWLSGVALVDRTGALIAQFPEHFGKPFDVTPLIEPDPRRRPGDLRAYAQISPAGPEIYIANPVYGSGTEVLRGLIVGHFDPRLLATMTRNPGRLIIVTPAGLLWPGEYGPDSIVATQDWKNILRRRSQGLIGGRDDGFFWTARYLGDLPIVYAMSVTASPSFLPESPPPSSRWRRSTPRPAPAPEQPSILVEPLRDPATYQAVPEADYTPRLETPVPDAPHQAMPF